MYQSGNYVVFINTEDFFADIRQVCEQHNEPVWFFSGYDCDSLALDPVTGFVADCLSYFQDLAKGYLELRTKSTQIRPILKRDAMPNVVVAYSLSRVQYARHATRAFRQSWRVPLAKGFSQAPGETLPRCPTTLSTDASA